eukprot:scaffold75148_cov67-Cyclotella_meneghiniana.AAC.6
MKLFTTALCLLLTNTAASSSASSLATFFGIHRHTAEMCLTETTDLFVANTDLNSAFDDVVTEIKDDDDSIDCWFPDMQNGPGNDIRYCNVNFDLFESAEGFAASCADVGGKTVKVSGLIECTYAPASSQRDASNAEPDDFVFSYENLLDCVSDTCEDGEVTDKIAETLQSTAEEIEGKFVGAQCTSRLVQEDGESVEEGDGMEGAMDIKDGGSVIRGQCHSLFAAAAVGGALMAL